MIGAAIDSTQEEPEQQSIGFAIIPGRIVGDERIDNAAIRVLIGIAMHSDPERWSFPSLGKLAGIIGVSKQAISKQIALLVRFDYLEKRTHFRSDGSQASNRYRVILDEKPPKNGAKSIGGVNPAVDPGSTSEVDPGSTSEVDPLTDQVNRPFEERSLPPKSPTGDRSKRSKIVAEEITPIPDGNDAGEAGESTTTAGAKQPKVTTATYQPDERVREWVASEYPQLVYATVLDNWRDYHLERGTAIKDHNASFRRWVRNERPATPGARYGEQAQADINSGHLRRFVGA